MAGMDLTPDAAFRMLTMEPSPLRDATRRAWLQHQNDEELIYWIGAAANVLAARHGKTEKRVLENLAELADYEDRASGASSL